MERLIAVMRALGGIASRRQLLARGFTGWQLTAAVHDGLIARVRQGHYALPDAPFDARAAVRLGGRLGCLSALRAMGFWGGYRDEVLHVVVPRNAARLRWFHDADGEPHVDIAPGRPCRVHWGDGQVMSRPDGQSDWTVGLVDALATSPCAHRGPT